MFTKKTSYLQDDNISGKVSWKSPSNIALVKYWGKKEGQIPSNPSVSFTLEKALTQTTLSYEKKQSDSREIEISYFFESKPNVSFEKRVREYFTSLIDCFPFLEQLKFKVESSNTFPHSAGIASSASAFSALALCLCSLVKKVQPEFFSNEKEFYSWASYLARLGSGSACRSIYPYAASWGKTGTDLESSDLKAREISLHPVFQTMRDTILIVDSKPKPVSSSVGHSLMKSHPYREVRFQRAYLHHDEMLLALRDGDIEKFGDILEKEALELHMLMATSENSYLLIRPQTLSIIEKLKSFRQETNIPVYFTLDAGPNIHLLYPQKVEKEVLDFIESQLTSFVETDGILHDRVGLGPGDDS